MSRLLVLAGLVLGLMGTAGANSVDFSTGNFQSGSLSGSLAAGGKVDATITGSLNTIEIQTGSLVAFTSGCPMGSTCFSFSGGMVDVGSNGSIFKDALVGGLTISASGDGAISAVLASVNGISAGTATATFDVQGLKITSGSEDVSFNQGAAVPEPSALLLMGTGLIPLATVVRRKFRCCA